MTLKLSIVLCTYKGAEFLPYQLDSFLAQTRLPDEIVVGDDASPDESWKIIQDFAVHARAMGINMRTTRHAINRGFVANFADTLRQATGDVIFLSDQDDVWRSDKLAVMEARFQANPAMIMLCSDARLVDAQGSPKGGTLFGALELNQCERSLVKDGRAFDVLIRRSMVTGATAALRRTALDNALPVGAGWIHDEWLAIVLSTVGCLGMIEEQLIDYRQHASNQVGMRKRDLMDKWRDLTRSRVEQFEAEVGRQQALEAHLVRMGGLVPPACLSSVVGRRKHFEVRVAMGRQPRWRRIPVIWREAWCGNYRRFGTGKRSVLRDLLRHG